MLKLSKKKHPTISVIVCGDFTINFLIESSNLRQLTNLLGTYCLKRSLNERTTVTATSCTGLNYICTNINPENFFAKNIHCFYMSKTMVNRYLYHPLAQLTTPFTLKQVVSMKLTRNTLYTC